MSTEIIERYLTDEEREEIMHQDEDQVFGDNNHVVSLNTSEREEIKDKGETAAQRDRRIHRVVNDARERLNRATAK